MSKRLEKMETRQWKLYEFLKENMDKYLSREEIMELSGLYENENARLLTSDLQAIKNNPTIKRILITSRMGIKIAETKEEANKYFEKEESEVLSRLKRLINQKKQYGLDQQMQIVFNSEKDCVEVFKK